MYNINTGASMMRHRLSPLLFAPLLLMPFLVGFTSSAQESAPPRVIDLTSPDGTSLKGTYFLCRKNPAPASFCFTNATASARLWDDLAARLSAAGIHVMTVDLRGYGDSSGTPVDKLSSEEIRVVFSEKMPTDVETAYQYLVSQPGVTRDTVAVAAQVAGSISPSTLPQIIRK